MIGHEPGFYLDNAATSFPKAPGVGEAMVDALESLGSPGRSGHSMSIGASRLLVEVRESLAELTELADPSRVIFTSNVTEALNLAILGLVDQNDCVVTSAVEHNSVMRPLRYLESRGLHLDVFRCHPDGRPDLEDYERALGGRPRLVVLTHASNVTGAVMPVRELADRAHAAGALVLVDAAQTAGCLPVGARGLGADFVALTGHKGLLGPTGTGALCIAADVEMRPLVRGGTGSDSERQFQPSHYPDALESGTPNVVGIAGLGAALTYLKRETVAAVRARELELMSRAREGLSSLPHVVVHGPEDPKAAVGLLSLSVPGLSCSEVALALEATVGVFTRAGLHCAPGAHRTQGTYPEGTTRVSWGYHTTDEAVDRLLEGLDSLTLTHARYLEGAVSHD